MKSKQIATTASAVAVYVPFYEQLAKAEVDNANLVFDYTTKKGDKEARSHIYSLRKVKSALDTARKEAKAESLKISRAIDSEASDLAKRLDVMIDVHKDALDAIEAAETARTDAIKANLEFLRAIGSESVTVEALSVALADQLAFVKAVDWQEAKPMAKTIFTERKKVLELAKTNAEVLEAQQRELAAAQAIIAAKEQEALIASRVALELVESDKRARDLEIAAGVAKASLIAAENRAAQQAIEAEERQKVAVATEAKRIKDAEARELATREANKAHVVAIKKAALAALLANGASRDEAIKFITLVDNGEVPNISINY